MRQKRLNLDRAHLARVALVMKKDEAFYPMKILRFGTDAVMLDRRRSRTWSSSLGGWRGLRVESGIINNINLKNSMR